MNVLLQMMTVTTGDKAKFFVGGDSTRFDAEE
jgi:hypothetical protein